MRGLRAVLPALALLGGLGCGYRRLDREPGRAVWKASGETVRLSPFVNRTRRPDLVEPFRKALENRVVAHAPWRMVPPASPARWVLQCVLESYEVRPLGLNLGAGTARGSAGTASRVEVVVVASLSLLDGRTGDLVASRPRLTFSNQYRVDQNFASFENRELQVLETLADDFAESFLTQLLQGTE